jgi:hypothetical protein
MATTHPPRLRVIPGGLAGPLAEPGRRRAAGYGDSASVETLGELPESPRRWRHAEGPLAGYCVAAAATAVAVLAGGTRHPLVALAVLAFALLVAARRMTLPAALASAGIAWLFYDGFIIGRHAQLVWDGARGAWWLLVLVAAAVCGSVLGLRARNRLPAGRPSQTSSENMGHGN